MKPERWQTFSRHDQLLNIGSAIMRASNWQNKDKEKFVMAIQEALQLLKLTITDQKWVKYRYALEYLEAELEKFERGERKDNIEILYQAL